MKKNFLKYVSILILIIIFLYAFSASYSSHSLDKLAYVIALGIDSSENDNLKVTFQFTKSSTAAEEGSSNENLDIVNTVEASSIDNAISLMTSYIGKELSLSHCKIIVFSEEIARNGISTQIYSLINNKEIRPSANIVVSKSSAKDYISNSKPMLDKLSTRYYETFFVSSSFTGFTADLTIGDFYNNLVRATCNPIAILGSVDSILSDSEEEDFSDNKNGNSSSNENIKITTDKNDESSTDNSNKNSSSENNSNITADKSNISGETTSKNFGIAVFKEDTLVGELSTLESICHLLIDNNIDSFLISVKNPISNNSYIDLSMSQSQNTKIDVSIVNGSIYISLELFVSGKVLTLDENFSYKDNSVLTSIEKVSNSYLENVLLSYLYKTSKEYKSDIDGFGKYALKSFLTDQEWQNFNWHSKYKDAIFNVTVNTNIESSMLLTNS